MLIPGIAPAGVICGAGSFEEAYDSGFAQFTYYRATHLDMRLCLSPLCGGVDLTSAGATQTEISEGLDSLHAGAGLIGFDRMTEISEPAGQGRSFEPSEFYPPIASEGPTVCGGFTYLSNPSCNVGEFCRSRRRMLGRGSSR
ncbi:MAG: hypothetical protein QMC74_18505 [Myxococcota bacterium]|mgnify:CR=1 FL=1|jgi:hypothetical protein